MAVPEEINADMQAFWNGQGGRTWVERQAHTDTTHLPVTEALQRAGIGRGLRLWGADTGICARRGTDRPRGGA